MSVGSGENATEQPGYRDDDGDLVVAGCPRLHDRLRARIWCNQLDRALARGVPAESTTVLALRARRLTALQDRRAVAAAYRRVLQDASRNASTSYLRIMPRRGPVLAASSALSRLAEALAQPGPVSARGAAQASLLLADGTGPLYNPAHEASLECCALRALTHLALT